MSHWLRHLLNFFLAFGALLCFALWQGDFLIVLSMSVWAAVLWGGWMRSIGRAETSREYAQRIAAVRAMAERTR